VFSLRKILIDIDPSNLGVPSTHLSQEADSLGRNSEQFHGDGKYSRISLRFIRTTYAARKREAER
jgi:hypothetical protein